MPLKLNKHTSLNNIHTISMEFISMDLKLWTFVIHSIFRSSQITLCSPFNAIFQQWRNPWQNNCFKIWLAWTDNWPGHNESKTLCPVYVNGITLQTLNSTKREKRFTPQNPKKNMDYCFLLVSRCPWMISFCSSRRPERTIRPSWVCPIWAECSSFCSAGWSPRVSSRSRSLCGRRGYCLRTKMWGDTC